MDQFLAEYFGNAPSSQPVTETSTEKTAEDAQVELFQKLAADNGIDLDSLSEEQVTHLWNATFAKQASDESEKKDEKEKESEFPPQASDKKDEAKKEHEEKKEAMAKMAEAEFLGKVMAHSMVAELRKIASATEGTEVEKDAGEATETETTEESKEAAMPPALAKALGKGKEMAGKAALGAGLAGQKAKYEAGRAGKAVADAAGKAKDKAKEVGGKAVDAAKKHKVPAAAAAGGAAVGAGAGFLAGKKKKEASAIDELALIEAVKMASEGGFDVEEVDAKLAAVITLGTLGESEKIASIEDTDAAIQVRALEYLEAAGYPVVWEQG